MMLASGGRFFTPCSMSKTTPLDKSRLKEKVGGRPGNLSLPDRSFAPKFYLISYNEQQFTEQEFNTYQELMHFFLANPKQRHWIDIRGYNNREMLENLIIDFGIHPLQMEDVINDYQRPKMEENEHGFFFVSRMITLSENYKLKDDQLSVFTGPNYVITLQTDYEDILEPLRERMRQGKGIIRKRPPFYMAYAIMDVVVDHYFLVMSELNEYFEHLEAELMQKPEKALFNQILEVRRELVKIRRIIWPEREKINEILRLDPHQLPKEIRPYFRDIYDHCIYLIDLLENYKDITSSLMELYMSTVNTRMNEIMKVLTIISSIFIPLSFVAGLYGMNFSYEKPDNPEMPLNMPELYLPYGYPAVMVLMGLIFCVQMWFFYKKGWLRSF